MGHGSWVQGRGPIACLVVAVVQLAPTLPALAAGSGPCVAGSVSLGHPDRGRLRCGRRLPARGPHHYVQPYTFDADFRYGADELVAGLLWVADRVHETTGIDRIAIGNLSRRGGGDHPLSGSHESGRDVDLPFLMKNGRGTHVESLYHAFDGRGFSKKTGRRHRFDVEGNWRLVRAVIECPAFEVALIVVAPGLKKLLLEHARANDADRGLVERAERLLAPPHWARPHDNHFHLRIRCPEGDVEAGCIEE